MKVAFDPGKDEANQAKHGVSLAYAAEVLTDPDRVDVLDVRFNYPEHRYVAYAKHNARVWVCVYTQRADAYRVISLRKANDRESRRYHAAQW